MIWQRTLRILRPPRRLRTTREGKIVLGIALAVGFAAINTGNNLLFLGWGTVLSAIVLSGILSEAALRTFAVESFPPQSARVDQNVRLPLSLANLSKHQTTFGMRVVLRLLYQGKQPLDATAPFEFCLPPGAQVRRYAHFTPRQRGAYHTDYLQAHTTYPFGFFDKSRRFHAEQRSIFWVAPARIPVDDVVISLRSRLGETPAGRVGRGEDFFSLRPFRQGDDVRFVHWRRSARVGRRVIIEAEAVATRRLILILRLDPTLTPVHQEHLIAITGSLAEALIEQGYEVGLLAAGTHLRPALGPAQAWAMLLALAKLDVLQPLPHDRLDQGASRVALGGFARGQGDADVFLHIPPPVEKPTEAA